MTSCLRRAGLVFLMVGSVVLSVRGAAALDETQWRREARPTGTVFHICIADACGRGSMVSCHFKAPNAVRDPAQFEKILRRRHELMKSFGICIEDQRTVVVPMGQWTLYREDYTSVEPNGRKVNFVSGFFNGPAVSVSLGSSAPSTAARRNFEMATSIIATGSRERLLDLCDPQLPTPSPRT